MFRQRRVRSLSRSESQAGGKGDLNTRWFRPEPGVLEEHYALRWRLSRFGGFATLQEARMPRPTPLKRGVNERARGGGGMMESWNARGDTGCWMLDGEGGAIGGQTGLTGDTEPKGTKRD